MAKTLLAKCVALTGHFPAAHVLYRAHYYVGSLHHTAAELSRDAWREETGLTAEQLKDALRRLRDRDLALVDLSFGPRKTVRVHLSAWALEALSGAKWPADPGPNGTDARAKWPAYQGQMAPHSGPNGPSSRAKWPGTLYIGEEEGVKREKEEYCDATSSIAANTGSTDMKLTGKSVAEIVAQAGTNKTVRPEGLAEVWRDAYIAQSEAKWAPNLTMKDRGQLKKFGLSVPNNVAPKVLDFAVRDWLGFTGHVRQAENVKTVPVSPTIGFLLRFAGQAYQFWYSAQALGLPDETKGRRPVFSKDRKTGPVVAQDQAALETPSEPTLEDILAPYKPE